MYLTHSLSNILVKTKPTTTKILLNGLKEEEEEKNEINRKMNKLLPDCDD